MLDVRPLTQYKIRALRFIGPVAQRLEQRTHKPHTVYFEKLRTIASKVRQKGNRKLHLPVSSKPFLPAPEKILQGLRGFAKNVKFVHPLAGKMGGLPKAHQLRRPVRFCGLRVLKEGRII